MVTLGQAYVQIIPKADGITEKLKASVTPGAGAAGKSAGSTFGANLKGMLLKAGIGAAVVKTLQSALDEGGKLQQSFGGLETLYGDAAAAAKDYALQAAEAGISANNYAEQAVSFGASLRAAFGGDTAAAAEAANTAILDMADNAAKMGTPLESIQQAYQGFAKGQYQLLDNLKLGYGGTKTEMQRLLADATKISGVEYNMDNLGDVYSAIHVIQGELGLTGVAADEAKTTFSGSFGAMKASAQNFLAALTTGGDVKSSMTKLLTSTSTFLFGNLVPMVGDLVLAIPDAISAAFTLGAQTVMQKGPELINTLITGIQTNLPVLQARGQDIIAKIRDGITQYAPILWEKATGLISEYAGKLTEAIPQLINKGGELITTFAQGIVDNLPTLAGNVTEMINSVGSYLSEQIPVLGEKAAEFMSNFGATIVSNIPTVISAIITATPVVLQAIGSIGLAVLKNLANLIPKLQKAGLNIIKGLARGMGGAALGLVRSAMNKIRSAMEEPIQKARDTLSGIVEKIKGFFPISLGKIFSGLELPHFKISGGEVPWGVGGLGTPPSVKVEWYKNGGIMNNPTLFGGGEAGAEAILPLDPFWNRMDEMADAIINSVNTATGGYTEIKLYAYPGGPQMDRAIVQSYDRGKRRGLK